MPTDWSEGKRERERERERNRELYIERIVYI